MKNDRRTFLKQFGGATAAVMATGALVEEILPKATAQSALGIAPSAAAARAYSSGKFILELDGREAGWLASVEGGGATGDVVADKLGGDSIQRKHIGGVKYEDITLELSYGMSNAFYDWLNATFQQKPARKSGSIIFVDSKWAEVSRLEFRNALITEIGFPALDAASKDAAKMTVKLTPESTKNNRKGAGQSIPPLPAAQKKWVASNFRLTIGGLETASSRVSKIDAFTIKQNVFQHEIGEQRDSQLEPAGLEIPNLSVRLAESQSDQFAAWHEDFVIKGNNGQAMEKAGTLQCLSTDFKTALFTLSFNGLGIFKLTPDKMEANSEAVRKVNAEMYCESINFKYQPAGK
jgi:phage tail-like protein